MAFSSFIIFGGVMLRVICETSVTEVPVLRVLDCCGKALKVNGSCHSTQCEPECYLQVLENGTMLCLQCGSAFPEWDNVTTCNYTLETTNLTTLAPVMTQIGGPGVAASVLLGTLLISLFLILSVASFFYLKRSYRLPGLFYRRNKAFIFQPSETAVIIPTPSSSAVRKPRYVRRERPSQSSTSAGATISTAAVTKVSNV